MRAGPAAIGVDVGGTSLKGAVVDAQGRVMADVRAASSPDSKAMVEAVRDLVARLRGRAGGIDRLALATAGVPRADGRVVEFCPGEKLAIAGIDWREALAWPGPVPLVNDANAALLGEAWTGAARGRRHVLLLTLGTGVGGAVMTDGALLRGARGRAGHVGHISLFDTDARSILGMPGSLEDAVGEQTIQQRTGGRFPTTAALIAACREGDPEAARVWQASIDALARGIASLVNVLDPEVVIIGGGIARAGDLLFDRLETALARIEWRPDGRGVSLLPAALGDLAGAIGAASLAADRGVP